MEGFDFGIPALLLTYSTIGLGAIFVIAAWLNVIIERSNGMHWRIPAALYTLTASIGVELAGPIVLSHLPYYLTDREVLGCKLVAWIWSCFLTGSFMLLLVTVALAHREVGPGGRIVRWGSGVLGILAILGFVGIIMGLPGMPLH